jgi:putative membrane protein
MIILLLIVFLGGALFTSVNTDAVVVDFYLDSQEMPLALALLAALTVGVLVGAVVGLTQSIKYRNQLRLANRQVKRLDKELENLRALPVRDTL